jgi:hypothetical protein
VLLTATGGDAVSSTDTAPTGQPAQVVAAHHEQQTLVRHGAPPCPVVQRSPAALLRHPRVEWPRPTDIGPLRGPVVLSEAGRLQLIVVRAMLRHVGDPRRLAMTLYRAVCTCGWRSILYHAQDDAQYECAEHVSYMTNVPSPDHECDITRVEAA